MKKLQGLTDTFKEIAVIYFGIILVSGGLFFLFEGKGYGDSIWWAFVTAMTVGYGDISPATVAGRILAVVLMHIVPLVLVPIIVARFSMKLVEDKNAFEHEEQEEMKSNMKRVLKKLRQIKRTQRQQSENKK